MVSRRSPLLLGKMPLPYFTQRFASAEQDRKVRACIILRLGHANPAETTKQICVGRDGSEQVKIAAVSLLG
jgi:hypothetical protein